MMPGAMLALFLAMISGRPDWWRRIAIFGLAGAIGWAFGGQSSYGFLVGYTVSDSFPDILYGYASFVLVGGMWGAIGGAILGMAITLPRSELSAFVGPLFAIGAVWTALEALGLRAKAPDLYDTYWVEAATALAVALVYSLASPPSRKACRFIILICTGWWLGLGILTLLFGLHLNPPRSDSWAACLGVTVVVFGYLHQTKNRAASMLALYGLLAGGIGFLVGDFVQVVQRASWGPFQYAVFQEHSGWGKMEKLFGLIMGLGIALGVGRLVRERLCPPVEDEGRGWLNEFAVFVLFVPMMWWNMSTNPPRWEEAGMFPAEFLGMPGGAWLFLSACVFVLMVVFALLRHRSHGLSLLPASSLGKGQLLFLALLGCLLCGSFTAVLPKLSSASVATTEVFYLFCTAVATVYLLMRNESEGVLVKNGRSFQDMAWNPGRRYWLTWGLVPLLVILFAWISVSITPPREPGHRYRFSSSSETR
jgi:hypothetical protein